MFSIIDSLINFKEVSEKIIKKKLNKNTIILIEEQFLCSFEVKIKIKVIKNKTGM